MRCAPSLAVPGLAPRVVVVVLSPGGPLLILVVCRASERKGALVGGWGGEVRAAKGSTETDRVGAKGKSGRKEGRERKGRGEEGKSCGELGRGWVRLGLWCTGDRWAHAQGIIIMCS